MKAFWYARGSCRYGVLLVSLLLSFLLSVTLVSCGEGDYAESGSDSEESQVVSTRPFEESDTESEISKDRETTDSESDSQVDPGEPESEAGNSPSERESEQRAEDSSLGLVFVSNSDGTCYLSKVGTCQDACVVIPKKVNGETVIGIAPSAFYGCASVTAIQIPDTVVEIGDLAFAGCSNLTYISVSAGNPSYQDKGGVLYSADGRSLIHYPASRGGSSVSISETVEHISAMAFYGCHYLKTVYYAGTDLQWERVDIASGNYSLAAAAVVTSSKGGK